MLWISLLGCGSSSPAPDPAPSLRSAGRTAVVAGELAAPELDEASGLVLASSGAHLWAIEDSENPPVLHAVGLAGEALGAVQIVGVDNVDWEDLSRTTLDGVPHLVIADVGDNDAVRPDVALVVVPEPLPSASTVSPAFVTRFTWEDGPRDCESVAMVGEQVVLVTKRDDPPRVYTLPLRGDVARRVGDVVHLPAPTPRDLQERFGRFRSQPTGLDVQGDQAVLVTYKDAYLFQLRGDLAAAFAAEPLWIDLPQLSQTEAVAMGRDGTVWVTTEGRPAPFVRLASP